MPRHVLLFSMCVLVPVAALAQSNGWEIEVHGGGAIASTLSRGTTNLPPVGAPLATPRPQFPSRRVSSWFLGDGAQLMNSAAAQFGAGGPFVFSDRITPLDAVLANPLAERQDGGGFGFRVSRAITDRFSAELNFDYSATPLQVPSDAVFGIQATAESFQPVFEGL